jgi:UDP-glucose 4-epimerase
MQILVCGGAGYIGSHMVRHLLEAGHGVVVLDNLSTGHRASVSGVPLEIVDLNDPEGVEGVFGRHPFDAVMHFSARSLVGESMQAPYEYYRNNVSGTLNLLESMRRHGVERVVFSSTAAVFGYPVCERIDEAHPRAPINPYGHSKLMVEHILADAARAYGLRSVCLRYFNAAGAHPSGAIGEAHEPETHLIPNILRSLLAGGSPLKVFGNDYDTPDGTCVRDYVHVCDLASAHALALDYMRGHEGAHAFNLGNGQGFSVLEIIAAVEQVTGRKVEYEFAPRRAGDPGVLVASSQLASSELKWAPEYTRIGDIIASAWRWHQTAAFQVPR